LGDASRRIRFSVMPTDHFVSWSTKMGSNSGTRVDRSVGVRSERRLTMARLAVDSASVRGDGRLTCK
jgi:hypothetical protein